MSLILKEINTWLQSLLRSKSPLENDATGSDGGQAIFVMLITFA